MRMTLAEAALITGGSVLGEATFNGVTVDSRTVIPGQLFVALQGDRDGHDFADAAVADGAAALLVEYPTRSGPELVVKSTLIALQALGRAARHRFKGPVIAITGSSGKTSTKDLLNAILRQKGQTGASVRSFNNELGVPITLLDTPEDAWVMAIEMGSRGQGHIALLCEMAQPNIGIVTNIGMAHLGEFGSVEAIAEAKGELVVSVAGLGDKGCAVLNADDSSTRRIRARTDGPILTFGEAPGADVRATNVRLDDDLRPRFDLVSPFGEATVRVGARGLHQVSNALAAAAGALLVGSSIDHVVAGLADPMLSPARMEVVRTAAGPIVINDAYNANPASMRAGLAALCQLSARPRVAVLGVMAELGPAGDSWHRQIADEANDSAIHVIAVNAPAYGAKAFHVQSQDEVLTALDNLGALDGGAAVLVKGSLVAGLQSLAVRLIGELGGPMSTAP